jgi:threonyl-tRNA synthetase
MWDKAEEALKRTLESFGHPWELNAGDGAFYGPKIDVAVTDALERKHQCATVQLDFQLPRRFELEYFGEDGRLHTPVIIHRAIFGSLERMLAIVLEHTAGKWPLWLSPRQCVVIPISKMQNEYAERVAKELRNTYNLFVDVSSSDTSLDKRILEAQHLRYNYMLVVGQKELESQTVSIRPRDTTATPASSPSASSYSSKQTPKQSSVAPKQPPVPLSEFVSRVLQEIRDFK